MQQTRGEEEKWRGKPDQLRPRCSYSPPNQVTALWESPKSDLTAWRELNQLIVLIEGGADPQNWFHHEEEKEWGNYWELFSNISWASGDSMNSEWNSVTRDWNNLILAWISLMGIQGIYKINYLSLWDSVFPILYNSSSHLSPGHLQPRCFLPVRTFWLALAPRNNNQPGSHRQFTLHSCNIPFMHLGFGPFFSLEDYATLITFFFFSRRVDRNTSKGIFP